MGKPAAQALFTKGIYATYRTLFRTTPANKSLELGARKKAPRTLIGDPQRSTQWHSGFEAR